MSIIWWSCAICLPLLWYYVQTLGEALVQKLTGRESRPPEGRREASFYALLSFGLGFWIAVPPIYLLPNADPLILCLFMFLGSTIGGLSAQWLFGRKQSA